MKNPAAPAVKREAEENWGKAKWRWSRPSANGFTLPSPALPAGSHFPR